MAEYIEREALLKDVSECVIFSGRKGHVSPEIIGANKVIDRIKRTPAADASEVMRGEWISVKDRLPDAEQEVLILTENRVITTAMYEDGTVSTDDSCWDWYDADFDYDEGNDKYLICEGWWEYRHYNPDDVYNNCVDDRVTHWMPLPEPPKGVKNEQ